MKLSTKYRYGSRAILEIAKNYGNGPIKRKRLVEILGIPDSYLENILVAMKNGGVIDTVRGAHGGYLLSKEPKEFTLYDIIKAMGGGEAPVKCLDEPGSCDQVDSCATRVVWGKMRDAMDNVLKEFTLQELLNKESNAVLNYII